MKAVEIMAKTLTEKGLLSLCAEDIDSISQPIDNIEFPAWKPQGISTYRPRVASLKDVTED
jgi:hypothetical protein